MDNRTAWPSLSAFLTHAEQAAIEQLTHSRTAPARLVERAPMVGYLHPGERVPAIARRLEGDERTVRLWLQRFQEEGLSGLHDPPRSGSYSPETVGTVLATAATKPSPLGLSFGSWTLDRLQAYRNEEKRIPIKRRRMDALILAEGLRWRSEESGFGERADPAFAEKREARKAVYRNSAWQCDRQSGSEGTRLCQELSRPAGRARALPD